MIRLQKDLVTYLAKKGDGKKSGSIYREERVWLQEGLMISKSEIHFDRLLNLYLRTLLKLNRRHFVALEEDSPNTIA